MGGAYRADAEAEKLTVGRLKMLRTAALARGMHMYMHVQGSAMLPLSCGLIDSNTVRVFHHCNAHVRGAPSHTLCTADVKRATNPCYYFQPALNYSTCGDDCW